MQFNSYTIKDGKKLRKGYTTGSTAAAAAKAATEILFAGQSMDRVRIDTPAGVELDLLIERIEVFDNQVRVAIIKDGGDDPDVTHGLEIVAVAEKIDSGIELCGGTGVGRVTKPGLAVEVGGPAINPVPEQMIRSSVAEVLPIDKGVRITIEVPKGEEIAKKTLNSQLGIIGGISILGTTGIVEPMSEEAYKNALTLEIDQALALGVEELVMVFGNYGKRMAEDLGYDSKQIVRMSNFVGFMIKDAVLKKVKKLTVIGHIGKMVKVSAGIFDTHNKVADARRETIAAYVASLGGGVELVNRILNANTAEETIEMIREEGLEEVFNLLAERVAFRVGSYIDNVVEVDAIIFSMQGEVLGRY